MSSCIRILSLIQFIRVFPKDWRGKILILLSFSRYENSNYHEECLKCNSCGLNLTGPNQKRARR